MREKVITFKATAELADWLAQLGAATHSTRSNVCFTLLVAAQHGQAADMVRIMRERNK